MIQVSRVGEGKLRQSDQLTHNGSRVERVGMHLKGYIHRVMSTAYRGPGEHTYLIGMYSVASKKEQVQSHSKTEKPKNNNSITPWEKV